MCGIVWFRRDLRVTDQPALAAADAACPEVIPPFVFDKPLSRLRVFGSACGNFKRCACRIGVNYPSPIVDHRQARRE